MSVVLLTGRRYGDRRFIKWTRFCRDSWLNIRTKCCKACGTGTQEWYCHTHVHISLLNVTFVCSCLLIYSI